MPTIKERIDQNVTVWLLGTLLSGFLAGIGTYEAVLRIAFLRTVSAERLEAQDKKMSDLEKQLAEVGDCLKSSEDAPVRESWLVVEGAYNDWSAHWQVVNTLSGFPFPRE